MLEHVISYLLSGMSHQVIHDTANKQLPKTMGFQVDKSCCQSFGRRFCCGFTVGFSHGGVPPKHPSHWTLFSIETLWFCSTPSRKSTRIMYSKASKSVDFDAFHSQKKGFRWFFGGNPILFASDSFHEAIFGTMLHRSDQA